MIKFGPSGPGNRFYEEGFSGSLFIPEWLKKQGLDLFEYSFGRGLNISEKTAIAMGEAFSAHSIELSLHAPYYINFANPDDDMAEKSYSYVINSALFAKIMGAKRIVFHPASQGKDKREVALSRTKERLTKLSEILRSEKLNDIIYCPETMGKIVQIGNVEEITELCKIDDIFLPAVDFGHVNAREQGSLKTADDFERKISYMINELGFSRVKNFHAHFSKIQYSIKGEIRHLNFDDTEYGPEFEPFIDACLKLKVEPHVICESSGNQTDDSLTMKSYYKEKNEN